MVLCGSTVTLYSLIKAVSYSIRYYTLAICYFPPLDKSKVLIIGTPTTSGDTSTQRATPELNLVLTESARPRPGGERGRGAWTSHGRRF